MTGVFTDIDGRYPHLKGERAELQIPVNRRDDDFLAQFDNKDLQEAFGWWRFPAKCFQVDPPVDWAAIP